MIATSDYLQKMMVVYGSSEQNLINHVIIDVLTDDLGYDKGWMKFEDKADRRTLSRFEIDDGFGNKVVVEVKRSDVKLGDKELNQIVNYINSNNIDWGILTNGYEWVLVNNNIKGDFAQKEVLRINVNVKSGEHSFRHMEYFSHSALFQTKVTHYLTLVTQFKLTHYKGNKQSWITYRTDIMKFITFLMQKHRIFVNMDSVQSYEFVEFFKWFVSPNNTSKRTKTKQKGQISVDTIKGFYARLNTFYSTLKKKGVFNKNPLEMLTPDEIAVSLGEIVSKQLSTQVLAINDSDIHSAYLRLNSSRDNLRNKVILSLVMYGLGRTEISDLKLSDYRDTHLVVNDGVRVRKIPLNHKVREEINQYLHYRKQQRIKSDWFVCKNNGNKLSDKTVSNEIVNKTAFVDTGITMEKLQQYILKTMILSSGDLISVSYISGLELKTLAELVSWDEVEQLADAKKVLSKTHFLNN